MDPRQEASQLGDDGMVENVDGAARGVGQQLQRVEQRAGGSAPVPGALLARPVGRDDREVLVEHEECFAHRARTSFRVVFEEHRTRDPVRADPRIPIVHDPQPAPDSHPADVGDPHPPEITCLARFEDTAPHFRVDPTSDSGRGQQQRSADDVRGPRQRAGSLAGEEVDELIVGIGEPRLATLHEDVRRTTPPGLLTDRPDRVDDAVDETAVALDCLADDEVPQDPPARGVRLEVRGARTGAREFQEQGGRKRREGFGSGSFRAGDHGGAHVVAERGWVPRGQRREDTAQLIEGPTRTQRRRGAGCVGHRGSFRRGRSISG